MRRTWLPMASRVRGTQFVWRMPRLTRTSRTVLVRVTGYGSAGNVVGSDVSDGVFSILRVGL